MPYMEHDYFSSGQSIRLCDETTGHSVKDVAFCHSEECAKFFCEVLNEWQKEKLKQIKQSVQGDGV